MAMATPSLPASAPAASSEGREAVDAAGLPAVATPLAPDPGVAELLLWQLADSALPTGGFAHSGGLEAAWQHGEVRTRLELAALVETSLTQAGWNALPLVRAAHAAPERLAEWDRLADAFTSNHVANRASRAQGRAFHAAAERIFPRAPLESPAVGPAAGPSAATSRPAPLPAGLECGHWAPVFGAVARRLGLDEETAARLFLHHHVRGLLAAAVRLNIIGPMEGQAMQFRLAPRLSAVARESAGRSVEDLAQTAPLLEIWQAAQDRLYSRLFQS
jgi:urease accessory protein